MTLGGSTAPQLTPKHYPTDSTHNARDSMEHLASNCFAHLPIPRRCWNVSGHLPSSFTLLKAPLSSQQEANLFVKLLVPFSYLATRLTYYLQYFKNIWKPKQYKNHLQPLQACHFRPLSRIKKGELTVPVRTWWVTIRVCYPTPSFLE